MPKATRKGANIPKPIETPLNRLSRETKTSESEKKMMASSKENHETKQFASSRCISTTCSLESPTKPKKQPGGWKAISYILANETFQRLAIFGLLANFMVYLTRELHLEQVYAATILNVWFGLSNFGPLLGAFISDAYVGRFWTIAFGSIACLLGMMVVTLTSWLPQLQPPHCTPQQLTMNQCVSASNSQMVVLFVGLGILSIGSAGVGPCSIPFGVDQFDPTTNEGKKGINSYFNWYYSTFTLALVFSQTVVIYVQDCVSWKLGFGIPTVCMFLSIIFFFVGMRVYVYVKPEGSVFSSLAQVFVAAYKKRKVKYPSEEEIDDDRVFYDPPLSGTVVVSKLPMTKQFRALNKAAIIMEGELNSDGGRVNKWELVSIQQIEEVKCIARIIPIWAAGILSLTSMLQQGTFTVSQALKMERHLGPNFQIPAGSLGVISLLTIAFWVPFYDRFLVPALRKRTKHEGGITLLLRIGIGMVFSVLSMVVAGLVEKVRRESANSNSNSNSPISVFWLAPQLILMGLFEAFNIIGQIEFFNRQFPEHMRSIGNSLVSLSFGVASYVSTITVNTVHHTTGTHDHPDWLTNDINAGRLDYFYYLVAGITAANLFCFIYVARGYKYKGSVELHDDVELGSLKE